MGEQKEVEIYISRSQNSASLTKLQYFLKKKVIIFKKQ